MMGMNNGMEQTNISRRGFFREIAVARHKDENDPAGPRRSNQADPNTNGSYRSNGSNELFSNGEKISNSHHENNSHNSTQGSNSTPLSSPPERGPSYHPWAASLKWNEPNGPPRSFYEYQTNDYSNFSGSNRSTVSREAIDTMNRAMDSRLNVPSSAATMLHKMNPAYKSPLEIHAEKKRQMKAFILKLLYFFLCLLFIIGFGLMLESAKLLGYVDSLHMKGTVGDNSGMSSSERASTIMQILKELSGEDVEKNGSAQNRAAQWITYTDQLQLPVPALPGHKRRFLQRYALATLYFATNGEQWSKQYNFLSGLDECAWNQEQNEYFTGAGACNEDNMITMITLWNNNLHGVIPKEISILSDLKALSLFDNMLIGNIPDEFTALDKLEKIYVHKNLLSGSMDFLCILQINDMRGDCEGPDPKISCTCCKVCCKRSGTCFQD